MAYEINQVTRFGSRSHRKRFIREGVKWVQFPMKNGILLDLKKAPS
jgi:hypothetical protein